MGVLTLLLGPGTGRAEDQPAPAPAPEVTGQDVVNEMAGTPVCKDPGVTVSFKQGSFELDTNARGALDGVASWLMGDSKRTLNLHGYADTTGTSESNQVLSEQRAVSVKAYLVSKGVSPTQVITVGRGEEETGTLPANGRTVTFLACEPPAPRVEAVAPPPPPPPPAPPAMYDRSRTGFGWALMAGGGFEDFSGDMRNRTNGAGAWDLRFIGGTHSLIGFEAAYVGASHGLQALGNTANNPSLVANGLEGTARLNLPIISGASLFEPYAYLGLGFSNYTIVNYNSNTATLSDLTSSDSVMTVPLGAGFAYAYKSFIADVRANYTATYYDNLMVGNNGSGTLSHWGIGGQVGFAF